MPDFPWPERPDSLGDEQEEQRILIKSKVGRDEPDRVAARMDRAHGWVDPVTADFAATVADDLVGVGFGLPDDGNHALNQPFRLDGFLGTTEALLRRFAGYERRAI
jgi:hypothetical protein